MAFSMKLSKEAIEGKEVLPAGIYEFRVTGFSPKINKNKDSVNFNVKLEVINNPDHIGRFIYDSLSLKAGFSQKAFLDSIGLDFETDGVSSWMPGDWDGDKAKYNPDVPETWVYVGPMLNQTGMLELKAGEYNGKPKSEIAQYIIKPGFTPRVL